MEYVIHQIDHIGHHENLFEAISLWCGYIDDDMRKWWVAYPQGQVLSEENWAGFAGVQLDSNWPGKLLLTPCEVKKEHRGHGLQKLFLDAREAWARSTGVYDTLLSLCFVDNLPSANNLIRAGFKLRKPWLGCNGKALYWEKRIVNECNTKCSK